MENTNHDQLLDMLKALADDSRLSLLRMLNEREHTVGELAERIELTEPTVSHHLARLREVGLVTLRMAGNQRFYRINRSELERFKRLANEIEKTPLKPAVEEVDERWITSLGWSAQDQQVLREYGKNGRLVRLPSKQKKLVVLLRWLATLFEAEKLYTEQEVNTILKSVYETDYVSLRRDLVDFGYLRRERGGGKYWLAPASDEV
jgi:predicted transcriptional regulator